MNDITWYSAPTVALVRGWAGGGEIHVPGIALPSWRWSGESRC